jgi:hypothetical protein
VRRVGLILLAIGVAGFLLASSQASRYERPERTLGAAAHPVSEARAHDAWESARWLLVGTAVMGLVFTALPGRREA